MQGGAALGAYEIGVYRVLYDWISMHIKEEENIFDIIAGTSIGAINSAILLNYVLERRRKDPTITIKQSWEGSADKLERFWQETSTQTIAEGPEFEPWWTWLKYTNGWLNWISPLRGSLSNSDASHEAARRHYSVKQIKETGARNFFSLSSVDPDTKFFDETPDNPSWCWPHYSNEPLKNIVKSGTYWNDGGVPIKTKIENGEPRLFVGDTGSRKKDKANCEENQKQTSLASTNAQKATKRNNVYMLSGVKQDQIIFLLSAISKNRLR